MPRRPAKVTQADVARTIRAARKEGAKSVEVRPDGTIVVMLKEATSVTIAPDNNPAIVENDIVL